MIEELETIFSTAADQNGKINYLNSKVIHNTLFQKKDLLTGISELDIETPVKLQQQLHNIWAGNEQIEDMEKVIVVAAFKAKDHEGQIEDVIQEKVYNF